VFKALVEQFQLNQQMQAIISSQIVNESPLDEISQLLFDDIFDLPLDTEPGFEDLDYYGALCVCPSYDAEWQYKKGGRKDQQYWIYSEAAQRNHMKWQFTAGSMQWNAHSRVMKFKQASSESKKLIFVEDIYAGPQVRGIVIKPESINQLLFAKEFNLSDLEEVPNSELKFEISIVSDHSEPVHPKQGLADLIKYNVEFSPSSFSCPAPFSYFASIQILNRVEGWFKIMGTLRYQDFPLLESTSDVFMLNNPRMKKHRELQTIPPAQVKFMQMCSFLDDGSISRIGAKNGFSPELITYLKDSSILFFSSLTKRSPQRDHLQPKGKRTFGQDSFRMETMMFASKFKISSN
jgi:hypothetical protein